MIAVQSLSAQGVGCAVPKAEPLWEVTLDGEDAAHVVRVFALAAQNPAAYGAATPAVWGRHGGIPAADTLVNPLRSQGETIGYQVCWSGVVVEITLHQDSAESTSPQARVRVWGSTTPPQGWLWVMGRALYLIHRQG